MNMGAYTHVAPRIKTSVNAVDPNRAIPHQMAYAGRAPSAATATGFASVHKEEQAALVEEAMTLS